MPEEGADQLVSDAFRRLLFALAYACMAAAGIAIFFTPTVLDEELPHWLYWVWGAFFLVGGALCALSMYTRIAFGLVGLPLLSAGSLVYAIGNLLYAINHDGQRLSLFFILLGFAINMFRRRLTIRDAHSGSRLYDK